MGAWDPLANHRNDPARDIELIFSAISDVESQLRVGEEVYWKSSRYLSLLPPPVSQKIGTPNDKESEREDYSKQEIINEI